MGDSMKQLIRSRAISICIFLVLGSVQAEGSDVLFRGRVTLQARNRPQVWETVVVSPNGKEHLRLALVPLWCVEGGIVAFEILVASPEQPDQNLLGVRENDVPQPFVITVEELESGINKSRFGANRAFKLRQGKLKIKILGSQLGNEGCECGNCIQELTAELSFQGK
jgi:hypothetical protein